LLKARRIAIFLEVDRVVLGKDMTMVRTTAVTQRRVRESA